MVLQILADARQVNLHRDVELPQLRLRADAGEHQQFRRLERACRQQHLAVAAQDAALAAVPILDACRPLPLEQDPAHLCARDHAQARVRSDFVEVSVDRTASTSAA